MVIPIAHDFTCPWCWIGLFQVKDLEREFGVQFEWRGYELFPEGMDLPVAGPRPTVPTNRPKTPGRLELAAAAQGMPKPPSRDEVRTHDAHVAVELAKVSGSERELVERLYVAFWENGQDLSDTSVLEVCASDLLDLDELREACASRRFAERVVPFDSMAYETGVFNVPTFFIGGERYAEQPIRTLRTAVTEALGRG